MVKNSTITDISFEHLADCVPAMIGMYNVNSGKYVYVNQAVTKILGYKPKEFISKGVEFAMSLVHPDDLPLILKKNTAALKKVHKAKRGTSENVPIVNFEYRMRHKNGRWIWLHTDGSIYDWTSDGKVAHVLNVSIDITQRQEAESNLQEITKKLEDRANKSEQKYKAFIRNSNEGIWRCELEKPLSIHTETSKQIKHMYKYGFLAEANEAMARMYNLPSADSLIGMRLGDLLVENDKQNNDYLAAFIKSGYSLSGVESHEKDISGQDKYFYNSLVGVVTADGHLTSAWGTQQDATVQHKATEAQRVSEDRLKVALKASRMGVWEWEVKRQKLVWSNELKKLFGLKSSDTISFKKYLSLLHPDDREKMQLTISSAQKTGRKYSIEHRTIWPDGSVHWILGKGQAFLENGKLVRMAGISLDIDDRKRAEELYKRQNEYLSALNETALEISKGLGDRLSILKIILARATKLARTPNGYIYLLDDKTSELTVHVATGSFRAHVGHKIKKGEGLAGKVWKTGKYLTVSNYDTWRGRQANFPKGVLKAAVGLPLYSGNQIIGVIALGYTTPKKQFPPEEITALKRLIDLASIALDNTRLYQELQEREERFSTLADTAPVFIWLAAPDTKVTYFNKGWLNFTGRTFEQEVGYGWEKTVHPDDLMRCKHIYEKAFADREPFTQEYRLRRHDGQYRWVLDTGVPRFSFSGEFLGFIGSCVDIHDLKSTTKRTQELETITASLTEQRTQLVALNDAKDEFISLASHQLRTPATGVKQFIGMLLENYFGELTDDQRTMLDYAYESNERQLEVINDLLKVAQVDAGKVLITKEKHDIADMLEDIMQEQRAQFAKRKQRVVLDRPSKPIYARVDARRMRMVVENLVDNASKYTAEGKQIKVSIDTTKSGKEVIITVKDQGVGIANEDIPKLFQKFSRLDNPLSVQVGGTGIGLYWAKKIVDLHGGDIRLKSKQGKGSAFIVRIPA